MKKLTRHHLFIRCIVALAAIYSKIVYATARVQVVTPLPPELKQGPVLLAAWHQQIAFLPAIQRYSQNNILALMSASRDGNAIAALGRWFDIEAASGSSHRGALTGTRKLIRAAKSGKTLFLTPDGPRGPACIAKQGATEVAFITKLPLIPCAAWAISGRTLSSWDKFRLPFPFTTIRVAFAPALTELSPIALQQTLNTLTAQAQGTDPSLATPPTNS